MMMQEQQFWGNVSGKSKMQKNQGRISGVLPPVQLYGASAILPRMTPYKQHGTHLLGLGDCACDLVAMMMQ
jgi:hypothetical protein